MDIKEHCFYSLVAGVVFVLVLYGIGRWSKKWGLVAAVIASCAVGVLFIFFVGYPSHEAATDAGKVAKDWTLSLDQAASIFIWLGATGVTAWYLSGKGAS